MTTIAAHTVNMARLQIANNSNFSMSKDFLAKAVEEGANINEVCKVLVLGKFALGDGVTLRFAPASRP